MTGCRVLRASVAIAVLVLSLSAVPASAEGLFEFLFGKTESWPAQAAAPVDRGPFTSRPRASIPILGRGTAFCVRMCDGRYFPIQGTANAQPGQICNSLCPASKTKVFAGPDISRAVAADGARYSALNVAFRYREETVDNCTCNGRTSYGLVTLDARNDPTLRAGDLVATPAGLVRSVAMAKALKLPDDEITTSSLPLSLRGRVSEADDLTLRMAQEALEITKPATRVSRAKRFHDMFAQRKRAR